MGQNEVLKRERERVEARKKKARHNFSEVENESFEKSKTKLLSQTFEETHELLRSRKTASNFSFGRIVSVICFLVPVTRTSGSRPTVGSSGHWTAWPRVSDP